MYMNTIVVPTSSKAPVDAPPIRSTRYACLLTNRPIPPSPLPTGELLYGAEGGW